MKNKESGKKTNEFLGPALALFGQFTGWILVPAFLGATLGMWLDERFGTEPWLFLMTLGVSFFVSMTGITKNALREYRKMNKKLKELDKDNKQNG